MTVTPFENETVGSSDNERTVATSGDDYDYYDYDYYYYSESGGDDGVHWPYLVFDVLLGLAVLVDLLLIGVVLSGSKLRRGPSAVFIISIAAFDLFHLVSIRVSLYVLWQFTVRPIAHLICKFGVFVDSMFGNTSVFLLVALAAERYVAVVHPLSLQKRRVSPFTWSLCSVLSIWALATVLAIPDIFTHSMEDLVYTEDYAVPGEFDDETTTTSTTTVDENATATATTTTAVNASATHQDVYGKHCALVGNGWLFWYPAARPAFGVVAYYAVPMLLIGVLYGRVVCTLLTTTSYHRHGSGDRERQQAARSLIVFVVIVVFCLLPVHVLVLLTDYDIVDTDRLYVLVYVGLYMFAVNSVFNAVIVTVISRQYRRRVFALVGVQRCRRRLHDTSINWTGSRTQRTTCDDHGTSPSPFIWHSTRV